MIEALKWQMRSWEQAGRYKWLTRAATFFWLTLHNMCDRLTIGRVNGAPANGKSPGDVGAAVDSVCTGPMGAGIRPMQVPEELAGLVREVAARKPKVLLEIGTARGGTLLLLCHFAAPDATIISIDLPYGRNGGGYPRWKERFYRSFAQPGQALHLLRANSHAAETVEAVRALAPAGIDFVLIDADHSYEGVRQDYRNYRPLLSEGGLLTLHDVLPNAKDPSIDVNRFWASLEKDPGIRTASIVADPEQGGYGIGLVYG